MKKLLIASIIFGLVGCSTNESIKQPESIQQKIVHTEHFIDLNEFPSEIQGFDLEFDWQFNAAEKYGSIAFKAIDLCYSKYEYTIKGIDTSSDCGSMKFDEYNQNVEKCVNESLSPYPIIPEDKRHKIPRGDEPGYGLELSESEIDRYDDFENSLPATTGDDKSYRNDPRFQELLPQCAANNMPIEDDQEFVDAVDLCVLKGM
ncbi:hypothetical protein ACX818_001313 [Acinetobacter baumannii]